MKIRHKETGVVMRVIKGDRFYETTGGSLLHINDPEWEPVIEPEWEDVTAGCTAGRYKCDEFKDVRHLALNGYLWITGADGVNIACLGSHRLTKIDGLHHGPAFIVERKRNIKEGQ